MVSKPIKPAFILPLTPEILSLIALGICIRFWIPLAKGLRSNMIWNCEPIIKIPIPANMPWITAGEMALNQTPNLKCPANICSMPANIKISPNIIKPCLAIISITSTTKPAAGPLTASGEPEIDPTKIPPIMPVITPAVGGKPDAMAIPKHKGMATKNTTIEAKKSLPKLALNWFSLVSFCNNWLGMAHFKEINHWRHYTLSRHFLWLP